ncbi:MAG: acetate--CoA ligase [Halobacteria archaeon]
MASDDLGALPVGERFFPTARLEEARRRAREDPGGFWAPIARNLDWTRTWDQVLDWSEPPFAKWFKGGVLNASANCLDRHLATWRRNKAALLWEGEPGDRRALTYQDLHREVNRFASGLRKLGVGKGDRVTLYMPMVPEAIVGMLACARLGATHSVVFSGFSAQSLADRINDAKAKVLLTADGAYRRGNVVPLKTTADEAVKRCPSVERVVVLQRTGSDISWTKGRDLWWSEVVTSGDAAVAPEPVGADHPLYILYTSGTTGRPKGCVHATGGYLVWLWATMEWVFDIRDEDVYWCTADVGWVTGHSYVAYGPLLRGATQVIYEGAPDTPGPDRWWSLVDRCKVNTLYTTPTAIRMFMRLGEEWPKKHDLTSLRLLGSVGEPINAEAWRWYRRNIGRDLLPIVDTWWQTETGGIMISPAPGLGLVPLKPGSATLPLPGIEAEVVDEKGQPCPPGGKGFIVIRKPWPGMFATLWGDPERFKQVYWSRFPETYYPGDYAVRDGDGYFWFLGRADEVIKVAGHRLGTLEIESALVSHPSVAEAAAAGVPDAVKGEVIAAFAVLRQGKQPSDALKKELRDHVRKVIGPVATPEQIYFATKLPKTRSGKIMRRVVKAVMSGQPVGDISTLEDEASVAEMKAAHDELAREMKG